MFPIERQHQRRFRVEGNAYYETVQRILDENSHDIIAACQKYLTEYETHGRPQFAVDIDRIIELMEGDD